MNCCLARTMFIDLLSARNTAWADWVDLHQTGRASRCLGLRRSPGTPGRLHRWGCHLASCCYEASGASSDHRHSKGSGLPAQLVIEQDQAINNLPSSASMLRRREAAGQSPNKQPRCHTRPCGSACRIAHLHPGALLLSNVVAVHDVQDLIPYSLGIAASAHCPQHGPHPFLSLATSLAVHLPTASQVRWLLQNTLDRRARL